MYNAKFVKGISPFIQVLTDWCFLSSTYLPILNLSILSSFCEIQEENMASVFHENVSRKWFWSHLEYNNNNNNNISFICMTIIMLQYCKSFNIKNKQTNKQTNHNNDNAMITVVNQVSSAWLDNKLLRKSLHNETNFNKCEFTEKFCEFINLIINSV